MEVFLSLFQAVIAFFAVLTGLGFVFSLLLGPVKENQARIEKELKEDLRRIEKELNHFKTEVNKKLDKLLSK